MPVARNGVRSDAADMGHNSGKHSRSGEPPALQFNLLHFGSLWPIVSWQQAQTSFTLFSRSAVFRPSNWRLPNMMED